MNPEEESPLKQIRTFQGDVADALKRQEESLVSIQQAEHQKIEASESLAPQLSPNSKRKTEFFFLFLGSMVLFVLAGVGAWYAYEEFVRKTTTPIATTPVNRFISANTTVEINVATTSRETFINTLTDATRNVPLGEVRHIVIRKVVGGENSLLPSGEFLEKLESRAPGSLVRAFEPTFMFGTFEGNVFIIMKLSSFENAFAGMLQWEKVLAQDIGPLFSTAPLLRETASESVFTDVTDRNKDIRMLASPGGQSILLYSFFDNNMLIITENIDTLRTLIDRLTREKLSR
ncbi:MAG: hypothetical protein Q8P21_01390 [bacterium]|nr:hypothetical protein [bacterium]